MRTIEAGGLLAFRIERLLVEKAVKLCLLRWRQLPRQAHPRRGIRPPFRMPRSLVEVLYQQRVYLIVGERRHIATDAEERSTDAPKHLHLSAREKLIVTNHNHDAVTPPNEVAGGERSLGCSRQLTRPGRAADLQRPRESGLDTPKAGRDNVPEPDIGVVSVVEGVLLVNIAPAPRIDGRRRPFIVGIPRVSPADSLIAAQRLHDNPRAVSRIRVPVSRCVAHVAHNLRSCLQ